MEVRPLQRSTNAPAVQVPERGFDKLQNPAGMTLVAGSIILFAWLCFVGARWVKRVSREGEAERRELKAMVAAKAKRPSSGTPE